MHSPPAIYPGLVGQTVFITGGGSGIGAAITSAFAVQHAKVAFVDVAVDESRRLAEKVGVETGNSPLFIPCDIRDVEELRKAIGRVQAELGDIAVLVNNAANDNRHEVAAVSVDTWDAGMAVNLRPTFFACQAVLPQMKRRGGGSIVNLSSTAWKLKVPDLAVYHAAKAGIIGLTRGLAREFGSANIRVNAVLPGAVDTERQRKLWRPPGFSAERQKGQCLEAIIEPEDVANLVLFLASDAAAKCTAQDFVIDCGWS